MRVRQLSHKVMRTPERLTTHREMLLKKLGNQYGAIQYHNTLPSLK